MCDLSQLAISRAHPVSFPAHNTQLHTPRPQIFDYMDHDMTGLLERTNRENRKFNAAQVRPGPSVWLQLPWAAAALVAQPPLCCALCRRQPGLVHRLPMPRLMPRFPRCLTLPLAASPHPFPHRRSSATCASCSAGWRCWRSTRCCTAT